MVPSRVLLYDDTSLFMLMWIQAENKALQNTVDHQRSINNSRAQANQQVQKYPCCSFRAAAAYNIMRIYDAALQLMAQAATAQAARAQAMFRR